MKNNILLILLLFAAHAGIAQATERTTEINVQQLEDLARVNEAATEDDSYLQQQLQYKRHPLNMNTATVEQLDELELLSALQVQEFILYRKLLGRFLNIYELQAIPTWDIGSIRSILPYITVTDNRNLAEKLQERWSGGNETILARYGRVLEKSKGYLPPADTGASHYLGSPGKVYLRYSYNYKNLLQWGILADKDAGEQFFKGAQRQGFDFYSFHFFARKLGIIKAVALGDFTVNFGQGLIQWQSLAFKKGASVLNIKRQSATLRPYNSAGEYNFQRGAGITLQKGNWETTLFASVRKISANNIQDTFYDNGAVSSLQASGYHRTPAENDDRNSLLQKAAGANINYQGNNWEAGISAVYYHFSTPIHKSAAPYNLFALQGSSMANASVDYGYTWRNIHTFAELSTDNLYHPALVSGAVISLGAAVDASVLYRNISSRYRSVNANAFTENTFPVNENGLYTGLSIRPANGWQVNGYADLFRFPWLKYRVDAPSFGKEYLLEVSYTPNKSVDLSARYKNEVKMINQTGAIAVNSVIDAIPEKNLRVQSGIILNRELTIRNRVEITWYNNSKAPRAGEGYSTFMEAYFKPAHRQWQGNFRVQYFETDGYNERIYTYEADLPYNFSIPFYYDKGFRYYGNFNWDASSLLRKRNKKLTLDVWLRWAQTIYTGKTIIGSGLDAIAGNHHSEIKFEIVLSR